MKSIFTALLLTVLPLTFAQAQGKAKSASAKASKSFERPYGLAGCGLGSVVIGKQGGQIFAATTNGTFSNQWFGISAGTLNCVDSPSNEVAGRMDQFILVNRLQVQGDVARGQGETIAALSTFMGCNASSNVGQVLKQNYNQIFVEKAQANEITDSIISVIKDEPALAQSCKQLG